jgi:hypothetical protein
LSFVNKLEAIGLNQKEGKKSITKKIDY